MSPMLSAPSRWGRPKSLPTKKPFVISIKTGEITSPYPGMCIVEVAVAEYKPGKEIANIKSYRKLVNPGAIVLKGVSTKSIEGLNIRKEDLEVAPQFSAVWNGIAKFLRSTCKKQQPVLIVYDADKEVSLVRDELLKLGEALPVWEFVCAKHTAKEVWPGESVELNDWLAKFKIGENFLRGAVASLTLICKILDEMNVEKAGIGVRKHTLGKPLQDLLFAGAKPFDVFDHVERNQSGEFSPSGHMNSKGQVELSLLETAPIPPITSKPPQKMDEPSVLKPISRRVPCRPSNSTEHVRVPNVEGQYGRSAAPVDREPDSALTAAPIAPSLPTPDNSPIGEERSDLTAAQLPNHLATSDDGQNGSGTAPAARPSPFLENGQSVSTAASFLEPITSTTSNFRVNSTTFYAVEGSRCYHIRGDCAGLAKAHKSNVRTYTSKDDIPGNRQQCNFTCKNGPSSSESHSGSPIGVINFPPSDDIVYYMDGKSVYHIMECNALKRATNPVRRGNRNSVSGRRLCGFCKNAR